MHLGPNEANVGLNPAEPTKKCTRCGRRKRLARFYLNAKRRDGRQSQCRLCHKAWYQRNKKRHKARVKIVNKARAVIGTAFVADYLATHPCVDCGEADPVVLEFDHVRGKKVLEISKMKRWVSRSRLEEEINKCDVRCANCHRRVTHRRRIALSFNRQDTWL
jgi:hypothetical protein